MKWFAAMGAVVVMVAAGVGAAETAGEKEREAALVKWLEGKEVVEVTFVGPMLSEKSVEELLPGERSLKNEFMFTVRGGRDAAVTVCMKVSAENVGRIGKLQKELEERGFRVEEKSLAAWSYGGNVEKREAARKMLPEVLAAAEKGVKGAAGDARWSLAKPPMARTLALVYVTGIDVYGHMMITEITLEKQWDLSRNGQYAYDDIHLPRLGLMIEVAYRPEEMLGEGKVLEKNEAVRKAFRTAIAPLEKLEAEAGMADVGKWLEGKESVQVMFVGPEMDLGELRKAAEAGARLPGDRPANGAGKSAAWVRLPEDFRLMPGERGDRYYLRVETKVTEESLRRMQGVAEAVAARGYRFDGGQSFVWAYKGDEKERAAARKLVPEVAAAVEKGLKEKYPAMVVERDGLAERGNLAALKYEIPGTKVSGLFRVGETTEAEQKWVVNMTADQKLHLPRLGLMVQAFYRPGQAGEEEDGSAERMGIRKVVAESLAPLMKMEAGAEIREEAWLPVWKPGSN